MWNVWIRSEIEVEINPANLLFAVIFFFKVAARRSVENHASTPRELYREIELCMGERHGFLNFVFFFLFFICERIAVQRRRFSFSREIIKQRET